MPHQPVIATLKKMLGSVPSRRNLLLGASAASVAALAAAASLSGKRKGVTTPVGEIDPEKLVDLGDGFYIVDGWVLSGADLESLPEKAN